MPMKIELEGATCVLTGRMQTMTKAQATRQLEAAGACVRASVSAKTTFVVVMEQWTNAHTSAKAMGLPILSEEDLVALLAGKSVEVEEIGEAGDRSVDELLGEVRSVMQGSPSAEMWHGLVALLDVCRAEDVHVLTEYIDGYIARWTQESMQGQQATTLDMTRLEEEDHSKRWLWRDYFSITGELRVAPEHWVGELQQGVRSPKFKVVRALDLRDSGISSKAVITLLEHPDLIHLEVLKLSMYLKMSTALIKHICQDARLRDLGPGEIGAKQNKAFLEHGKPGSSLRVLDLRSYGPSQYGDTCEFLSSSAFNGVESVTLCQQESRSSLTLEYLDKNKALGQVRRLAFTPYYGVDFLWRRILRSSWVIEHIRELDLGAARYREQRDKGSWKQFLDANYGGHLEILDLSGLRDADDELDTHKVDKMLTQFLPASKLLEHVDVLVLGMWKTPELVDKLIAHCPDMEVR